MTSIRRQLTWRLLAAFSVPVIAGAAVTFALIRDESIEQFDAALEARAQAVTAAGLRETTARTSRHESEVPEDEGPPVFQIRSNDGRSLVRSAALGTADLPFHGNASESVRFWNLVLPSGAAGRAVEFRFRPGSADKQTDPAVAAPVIVFAGDRRDLDQTIAFAAVLLAASGGAVLLATFLIVPRVVRRSFAPIEALADEATRIDADSLSARFSTHALPVELAPIAQRLNDLLLRLEQAFERERRFSGDVAHELRTPLAELRSLAELATKWPDARPADADHDVLAIANHMEGIVSRLLTILRSEHGKLAVEREDVDLIGLIQQTWSSHQARAAARSLTLRWSPADRLVVSADPVLLRSIALNLVQNAVDYSPVGGGIAIDTRATTGGFVMSVTNDVSALSSEDVARMFDRFWRGDAARSGVDRAGLGLSLARALARAMSGDLTAELDSAAGHLRVTLTCSTA